jgi:predicted CXXCH cytochrome family protein
MRRLAATVLLASTAAWASDPPHDLSSSPAITCDSCHTLHVNAKGATLTNVQGNANLCKSCHDGRGPTFAWSLSYQAVPGKQGRSHRWDAPAVSSDYQTSSPTNAKMAAHLSGTNIQCSTCHDPHGNVAGYSGTQRVSIATGTPATRTAGTGTGTMTLNLPAANATAKGYRLDVVQGGATGTATFRVSNDNGVSWFGWSGAWTGGTAAGRPTGANVALNDGTNVTVTFAGTTAGSFVVGDRWDFYVAYPILQMANTDSAMCENCHLARVQSAASIESGGDGTKVFSHPVGEALSRAYDRDAGALLDTNGLSQATGDGLVTNDLKLDSAQKVRCQTCHSIHNADSNSLTEDLR